MSTVTKPKHLGRNISRIRELRQMKQEALAIELGVSQQTVSAIEKSEEVDKEKLKQIAEALKVTVEAIKNFNDEDLITYFNNNFYDNATGNGIGNNHNQSCNFNPLDKLMEAHEENKQLYERLLESEKENLAYLEKLLNDK